ncbi:hypothetical protein MTR67_019340 [Solanum verrucosum]|uniref:Uncharacterized protein n=1 Tax=Solanum verrucosum TaxID=315347 RepID=A0AAF0QNZ8_SOLVR|nr:hypothetical protein MTR67_019340 [Solanum verrucosum]
MIFPNITVNTPKSS